jgi:mono/diheme cytochrome c family protein
VLRGLIQIKRPPSYLIKRSAIRLGLAAGLPFLLMPAAGNSADLAAGELLADTWCARCHGVRAGRLGPNPCAPTFSELAGEPSITEYSLRALLRSRYETMPQIMLTPDETDDIVDYFLSLKTTSRARSVATAD